MCFAAELRLVSGPGHGAPSMAHRAWLTSSATLAPAGGAAAFVGDQRRDGLGGWGTLGRLLVRLLLPASRR
jgi:hypothetical protein